MPDASATLSNSASEAKDDVAKAGEGSSDSKPVKIGIIYPPPEVRNIVDKTADFVARNGPEFEARIRQNEISNPKFNFLNVNDPYHAYYQHKVREFREGRAQESTSLKATVPSAARAPPLMQDASASSAAIGSKLLLAEQFVPKEPPPDPEFIVDPPSIKALDLDIVKLTAQFVARNGRQFLTQVMNREQRNFQFDFLRPQHNLFNYFTKLVEQYTKILIPPKDLVGKLTKEAEDWHEVHNQVRYRVEWQRWLERQRRREEEAAERERVAYAQIDWHDFVVVETVDYQPHEVGNFPPPTTPEEVGARVLAEERGGVPALSQKVHEIDLDLEEGDEAAEAEAAERAAQEGRLPGAGEADMEQSSDEEMEDDDELGREIDDGDRLLVDEISSQDQGTSTAIPEIIPPPPPPPPMGMMERIQPPPPPPPPVIPGAPAIRPTVPPRPDQVLIRRDYDPKALRPDPSGLSKIGAPGTAAVSADEALLVSPFTGERIPASAVQKHMRVGLLDPKWMEQRDRELRERQEQEQVYAPGVGIQDNLKNLAERRTDIFGVGVDETAIGKKLGEEAPEDEGINKPEKLIWDGHSASMEKIAKRARESITAASQAKHADHMRRILKDDEREKIGPQKTALTSNVIISKPSAPAPPPPPPPMRSIEVEAPPKPPPSMVSASAVAAQAEPLRTAAMIAPPRIAAPPPMLMMQRMAPQVAPVMAAAPQPVMAPPQAAFMSMSAAAVAAAAAAANPVPTPVQGMSAPAPPGEMYEPPGKKQRTEESLVPEDVFLRSHKGSAIFKVIVPSMPDKSEWRLVGQVLTFTMNLVDSVAVLKQRVFDECGIPIGKQKLQMDGLFLKDNNTLAFYNILNGSAIHLLPKERGGRKK